LGPGGGFDGTGVGERGVRGTGKGRRGVRGKGKARRGRDEKMNKLSPALDSRSRSGIASYMAAVLVVVKTLTDTPLQYVVIAELSTRWSHWLGIETIGLVNELSQHIIGFSIKVGTTSKVFNTFS